MVLVTGFSCLLLICSLQFAKSDTDEKKLPRHRRELIASGVLEFDQLHEVFQSYPVDRSNTDQSYKLFGNCDGLSGYREIIHSSSVLVSQAPNPVSKPCHSILRNCRADESMSDYVSFCVSSSSRRRYDYMIKTRDKRYRHVRDNKNFCRSAKFEHYFEYGVYYPCVCDCESSEREVDRYFSLLDVVSDDDKVVTGVRFKKVDHVFYIQIQQGKLGPNRAIDGKVEWKDVKSVDKSDLLSSRVSEYYKQEGNNENLLRFHKNDLVYAVTYTQDTVLLDNLEAGPNEVLTGLKFRHVDNDLGLEIQVTPFNEETGILQTNASRWLRNDIDKSKRQKAILPNLKVPGRNDTVDFSSSGYRFIKFQASDFKKDLGQTTVPFIDLMAVDLAVPQPLSGAGIFHKGSPDSAGFIALKIFSS